MNPQEQRLIENLFTRLQSVSSADKDEDAARHIRDLVARFPDAPYYLTQSVLVQEQALIGLTRVSRSLSNSDGRHKPAGKEAARVSSARPCLRLGNANRTLRRR